MNKETEIVQWFTNYLIQKLGYSDANLISEKRIDKIVIDLLLIDNTSLEFNPIAIIEFKEAGATINDVLFQIKKMTEVLKKPNIPAFLVHGQNVYVLQTYGWQKIDLIDFPNLEKLK